MIIKNIIEYVVYEGDEFTIEWFFDEKGKSQSLDYYKALDQQGKIQLLKLVKRMGDGGIIHDKTKFRHEGDKIYAFKPQPDRFLCFFYNKEKVIITNAFRKKQQKLPKAEKEKAEKYRQSYRVRVKKGDYYE